MTDCIGLAGSEGTLKRNRVSPLKIFPTVPDTVTRYFRCRRKLFRAADGIDEPMSF